MSGPDGPARPDQPEKPPTSLEIRTPANWWDLPLNPSTRRQDLVTLVERRAGDRLNPSMREQLVETLDEAAAAALAAGAVIASQVGAVAPGLAFGASVVVAVDPIDSNDLSSLERYVAQMPVGAGIADREVEVVRVDLEVGPAVRRRAIRTFSTLDVGDGSPEEMSVQYFLPIPGTRSTAIVACGSPDTKAVEDLTSLFEAIAGTLRFVDSDEGGGTEADPD
jgi:hypothetical protein